MEAVEFQTTFEASRFKAPNTNIQAPEKFQEVNESTPTIARVVPQKNDWAHGVASRIRTLFNGEKLAYVQQNIQTACCCPGSPSVALEFLTLTTQFAFGHGCNHAGCVVLSFPSHCSVGNAVDFAMLSRTVRRGISFLILFASLLLGTDARSSSDHRTYTIFTNGSWSLTS